MSTRGADGAGTARGGVHQFVPILHAGDAVGQHTVELQALLRRRGVRSEVYVELEDPETATLTRRLDGYAAAAAPGDLLVYQLATASDMADWLAGRSETLVVNYHNLTPPELLAPWDNGLARHQVRAAQERDRLARRAALAVAVSEVNRADLVAAGYRATAVVPPIVRLLGDAADAADGGTAATAGTAGTADGGTAGTADGGTAGTADGGTAGTADGGTAGTADGGTAATAGTADGRPRRRGARWLSVGRLAPNKSLEDAMVALLAYRMRHDPAAELVVAGRAAFPAYARALRRFAAELGLGGAVHFEGRVSDRALSDLYRSSDVLVVVSAHEGFCLPVVEAMAHRLPVVAVARAAVPEVLGGAGVLLADADPLRLADAVWALQSDPPARAKAVGEGCDRVGALRLDQAGPRLVELLLAARDHRPWPAEVRTAAP
ncbi:MAG: glycosyltransferase [Acidimicrobiales bacterium]